MSGDLVSMDGFDAQEVKEVTFPEFCASMADTSESKADFSGPWPQPGFSMATKDRSNHFSDLLLNGFVPRDDDIYVCTFGKSGTTWAQAQVEQILTKGAETSSNIHMSSAWIGLANGPPDAQEGKLKGMESMPSPRSLKMHCDIRAVPSFNENAKYIWIVRSVRDVARSLWNHHNNFTPMARQILGCGPPCTFLEFYTEFVKDGRPYWPLYEHILGWWTAAQSNSNIKMMHYNRMKADPEGTFRELAEFLGATLTDEEVKAGVEHTSISYMKARPQFFAPPGDTFFQDSSKFVNKGTNGRWSDVLTEEHEQALLARLQQEWPQELIDWVENSTLPSSQ